MEKQKEESEYLKLAHALNRSEFHYLDAETKTQILSSWVKVDYEMRSKGQPKPIWDGSVPMSEVIGHEVVAKTDKGEMVGKAIYSTTLPDSDGVYKHAVVVHVPASGSILLVHGRNVRPASQDESKLIERQVTFAKQINKTNETIKISMKEKRSKRVSGTHLLESMLQDVKDLRLVVEEKSGFYKIFGNKKGVCIYLANKGGRADLSGFSLDIPGIKIISEEAAKERHLGKVRGQVDFDRDDKIIMEAWRKVLSELG